MYIKGYIFCKILRGKIWKLRKFKNITWFVAHSGQNLSSFTFYVWCSIYLLRYLWQSPTGPQCFSGSSGSSAVHFSGSSGSSAVHFSDSSGSSAVHFSGSSGSSAIHFSGANPFIELVFSYTHSVTGDFF